MREQAGAAAFLRPMGFHASSLVPRVARILSRGDDDPVLAYLLLVVRSHRHGLRTRNLLFSCAVAVVAALFQPMGLFSFAAWMLFVQFSLVFPLLTFPQEIAARDRGVDLLAAPISGGDYARGFTRFFVLATLFAAVVHAVFWVLVLLLRLTGREEYTLGAHVWHQTANALLLFVLLTAITWSVVWTALWSPLLGVVHLTASMAVLGAVHGWRELLFLSALPGLSHLPQGANARFWLLAAVLLAFGSAMRHVASRTLTRRLQGRLFG